METKKASNVYIIGVGQTKFMKPQSVANMDYPEMINEAVGKALDDAQLKYMDVDQAVVGYIYGGTCCGQRALYELGLTGIPIHNVNNACASGSTAIYLGTLIIESGAANVILVVGYEKMVPGPLESMGYLEDRSHPLEKHISLIADNYGLTASPIMTQIFGCAAREHMQKYGTKREHFAKIAEKNHRHSINNPAAQFQKEYSLDDILNARKIHDLIGLLECSPTSDGAAAVLLCSEKFLQQRPQLHKQAVQILGMKFGTDRPSVFKENSAIKMTGFDMVNKLSTKLYHETGITPDDIQVIELHDCFASNELITYEALGLCNIGCGSQIVDRGDNTFGGKWVINPSGGLISKGHPIGATGVAQAVELTLQLRGLCGKRQVPNCKLAMQHNIGLGGAAVVALYRMYSNEPSLGGSKQNGTFFKSDIVFKEIETRSKVEEELVKKVASSFRFIITDDTGKVHKKWVVDCKKFPAFVGHSDCDTDVEIAVKENDFMKIVTGKLRPDQAFMRGQLKIRGKLNKAIKLRTLLKPGMLKAKL